MLGRAGSAIVLALAAHSSCSRKDANGSRKHANVRAITRTRDRRRDSPARVVDAVGSSRCVSRAVVTLRDDRRGLLFVQDLTGGLFVSPATAAGPLGER